MCDGLDDVSVGAADEALKTYADVAAAGGSDASLTEPDADRLSDKSRLASSRNDSVGYGTVERNVK